MIDEEEEDVEEKLKRKISWKAVLKGIIGFLLLGGGFVLIQFSQSGDTTNTTYLILGITLLCMASSVMVPVPQKKKEVRHTISILKCKKCGYERVHDYAEGDFVFKETIMPCDKCDGNFQISKVYSLKLKSKGKKKTTKEHLITKS